MQGWRLGLFVGLCGMGAGEIICEGWVVEGKGLYLEKDTHMSN